MRELRGILVVADAGERWLRTVAARWATAGIRVTWLAGRGAPDEEIVDGVRVVRTRGSVAWRARVLAARHDAVLVTRSGCLVCERPARRPRGTVVVDSPARRRAVRADTGLRRPVFVVPRHDPVRAADLLAGVLLAEVTGSGRCRRRARPDLSTVVGFPMPSHGLAFRATDEVWVDGERAVALLHGCDEVDARIALARQHIAPTFVRLATDDDLLFGPAAARRIG